VREARGGGAQTDDLSDFNPFSNDQTSTRVCVTLFCTTYSDRFTLLHWYLRPRRITPISTISRLLCLYFLHI